MAGRKRVRTDQERVFTDSYGNYRRSARARSLVFRLTPEQAHSLFSRPCSYCGRTDVKCTPIRKDVLGGPKVCYVCNGIDRIDNARGYEPDNVTSCCALCNLAKRDLSRDEWHAWLLAITTFQKSQTLRGSYA